MGHEKNDLRVVGKNASSKMNAGMTCPKCFSDNGFELDTRSTVRVSATGWQQPQGLAIKPSDTCTCLRCKHQGHAFKFIEELSESLFVFDQNQQVLVDLISPDTNGAVEIGIKANRGAGQAIDSALSLLADNDFVESVTITCSDLFTLTWYANGKVAPDMVDNAWVLVSRDRLRIAGHSRKDHTMVFSDYAPLMFFEPGFDFDEDA